jgi:hypothetical protein
MILLATSLSKVIRSTTEFDCENVLVTVMCLCVEMYSIFTEYSLDNGTLMDNSGFTRLLRDAKVLSKHDISMHYANMIFREHASKLSPPKRLNFTYFRTVVLPLLAEKKKMSEEDLLNKFCRFEDKKQVEAALALEEETIQVSQSVKQPSKSRQLSLA